MAVAFLSRPPVLLLLHLRPGTLPLCLRSSPRCSCRLHAGCGTRRHMLLVPGAYASPHDRTGRAFRDPGADLLTQLRIAVRTVRFEGAESCGVLPWLQDERAVRIGPVER